MDGFENIGIPWPGWKIVKELGEGSYGKVYEIERTQYGITENDALKIIRIPKDRRQYDEVAYRLTSEDEESIRAVFSDQKDKVINEIRAMQQLKAADNIVSIKDWSVSKLDDGYSWEIYIRMDVMTPLVQYVKKNKGLEEEEVIKLGEDICKALKQCEKENIVHRDIKPDNIMVPESGRFMLGDFGIARYLENDTTMTGIGTKPYMAPEIANYKKAGKTVDLYSLGMVLYEMLNNCRPPFIKANGKYSALERENAIQRRIRGEELPEPANGSDELKKIVLKACDPEPSKRYKTAAAMLKAFEDLKIREHKENEKAEKESEVPGTTGTVIEEAGKEALRPAVAGVATKKEAHSVKKTGYRKIIVACIAVAVLLIGAVIIIDQIKYAKEAERVLNTDEEYDLKDLVGVYSNGQSNIIIRRRMDSDDDDKEVSITIRGTSEETPMLWTMNGSFDSGTATISYNEGDYYEAPASGDSNKLDIQYSDGSGSFVFKNNVSFIWEDDKDGAGNGEIFTKCESHADKAFAGIWQRSSGEYYELNEDGSYSFNVDSEQVREGSWAVIEAPFGDETRYYIITLDDSRELFEYSKYSENVDCMLLNNTNIFFRGDE